MWRLRETVTVRWQRCKFSSYGKGYYFGNGMQTMWSSVVSTLRTSALEKTWNGQGFLRIHWNELVKKLAWSLDAKEPWPGKPRLVKHWMNNASLILCGKTSEVLATLLIWHQKKVDSIMIIGVFYTAKPEINQNFSE